MAPSRIGPFWPVRPSEEWPALFRSLLNKFWLLLKRMQKIRKGCVCMSAGVGCLSCICLTVLHQSSHYPRKKNILTNPRCCLWTHSNSCASNYLFTQNILNRWYSTPLHCMWQLIEQNGLCGKILKMKGISNLVFEVKYLAHHESAKFFF